MTIKKRWQDGDVVTGSELTCSMLQLVGHEGTSDSINYTNTETTFTNKSIAIPATVRSKVIAIAHCYFVCGNAFADAQSVQFNIKIGSPTSEASKKSLTCATQAIHDNDNAAARSSALHSATLFAVDESTDFTTGSPVVIVTASGLGTVNEGTYYCDSLLVLGA